MTLVHMLCLYMEIGPKITSKLKLAMFILLKLKSVLFHFLFWVKTNGSVFLFMT